MRIQEYAITSRKHNFQRAKQTLGKLWPSLYNRNQKQKFSIQICKL